MKVKGDTAVFVGRFQIDKLHSGQLEILKTLVENYQKVVVVLGISPILGSQSDPLDYVTRELMIRRQFPFVTVIPIADCRSDKLWSEELDKRIHEVSPLGNIVLYGGRDSFIPHYFGKYKTVDVETTEATAGTSVRELIGKTPSDTEEFRKGVIYSTQNNFPRIFPVVDIAMIDINNRRVLLGTKFDDSNKLRFPGGFVDQKDESLLAAAKRELREETRMFSDTWKMIGSTQVKDWRMRDDVLMSTMFACHYQMDGATAGDDLLSLGWYYWGWENCTGQQGLAGRLQSEHKPLWDILWGYLKSENYV
jgi:bifunctional NMN adenylyltransferase/nudix hydrolase